MQRMKLRRGQKLNSLDFIDVYTELFIWKYKKVGFAELSDTLPKYGRRDANVKEGTARKIFPGL